MKLVVNVRNVTREVRTKSIALRLNSDGGGSGNGGSILTVGSDVEIC